MDLWTIWICSGFAALEPHLPGSFIGVAAYMPPEQPQPRGRRKRRSSERSGGRSTQRTGSPAASSVMEIGRHETEKASLSVDAGAQQLGFACTAACFGALECNLAGAAIVAVDPLLGAGKVLNAAELRGAIAVMKRGEISFVEKALKAQLRKA
eukprot:COSAG06_NODE_19991_length_814_cov_1.022378_1_plen_152_part_01